MRLLFAKFTGLTAALLVAATVHGQVDGNATISANGITIGTSSQYGGAIFSLQWGGKEFINNWDHGRQIGPNYEFFNRYECYNVYETGSKDDGSLPTTSSRLLAFSATDNALESTTQLAWYMPRREPRLPVSLWGDYCGDPSQWITPVPPYTGQPSAYTVHKSVTIGFAGIPNVVEYHSDLLFPEAISKGLNQITAVLEYDFSTVRSYDVVKKEYRPIREFGGGDENVKVMATADGAYAFGFYSPEMLQFPAADDTANWWYVFAPPPGSTDPEFPCVHVGSINKYETAQPGDHSYDRAYFVIGNIDQVRQGLINLHLQFAALDPEVFDWREYVAINHLESALPTRAAAEDDWLNNGIAAGRAGSRTFSPSEYLQLNPDVASANSYQLAINHYVTSGRSEGRNTVAKAAAGMQHLVDLSNRTVTTAGQNAFGQFGNGDTTASMPTELDFDKAVTEVAAGDYTSFAVKSDGSLWVWGSNKYGAHGDGSSGDDLASPVQVPLPAKVSTPSRAGKHAVAVGTASYAAIDDQGQVWTWGANWNGRLGDGTTTTRYLPARVKKSANPDDYLNGIVSITAGGGTMAALDADGAVWTWGAGETGALGNGSTQDSPYAVQVMTIGPGNAATPLAGITQVACGSSGFCVALIRYGGVFGWGSNDLSQLGVAPGGNVSVATWIPVASTGAPVDAIAAGAAHCVAHATDGNVYGWGYNGRGQLGTGATSVAQFPPVAMTPGPDAMHDINGVSAGADFSVMVRNSDRSLFVVGDNQSGQLGSADSNSVQLSPVRSSLSPH